MLNVHFPPQHTYRIRMDCTDAIDVMDIKSMAPRPNHPCVGNVAKWHQTCVLTRGADGVYSRLPKEKLSVCPDCTWEWVAYINKDLRRVLTEQQD